MKKCLKYFIPLLTLFFIGCSEVTHISYDRSKVRKIEDVEKMNFFNFTNFLAYNAQFSNVNNDLIIKIIKKHYEKLNLQSDNYQLVFLSQVIKYFSTYASYKPINKENSEFIDNCYKKYLEILDNKQYSDVRNTFLEKNSIFGSYISYLTASRKFNKSKKLIDKEEEKFENNQYNLTNLEKKKIYSNFLSFKAGYYTLSGKHKLAINFHLENIDLIKKIINKDKNIKNEQAYQFLSSYLYSLSELALLYSDSKDNIKKIKDLFYKNDLLNKILNGKYSSLIQGKGTSIISFSISFAKLEDKKSAMDILEKVKNISTIEKLNIEKNIVLKLNFLQNEALINYYLKNYKEAEKFYDRAYNLTKETNFNLFYYSLANMAKLKSILNKNEEASELYEKAIKRYEYLRSGFAIDARGSFFETDAKSLYINYIDFLINKYNKDKSTYNYYEILTMIELFKGRQLGDLKSRFETKKSLNNNLKQLQKKLKKDDLVLEFITIDKKFVILAITKDTLKLVSVFLPNDFFNLVKDIKNDLSTPFSDLNFLNNKLSNLSRVLIYPIKNELSKSINIYLSNEGILNIIPFDLLSNNENYKPLILEKNIFNLVSLKQLLQENRKNSNSKVLVVANPNYEKIKDNTKNFNPLPETSNEAKNIEKLYGISNTTIFEKSDAKESLIKNSNLKNYKYLHFATHGVLGNQILNVNEPALILSNENNNDGFFTSSEIEDLNLDADLTVLSACNTGTGELVSGEGVQSLSRSFLVAGSKSVVVSLWEVPSNETVDLMNTFYKNLKNSTTSSEALRKAKIAVLNSKTNKSQNTVRGLKKKKFLTKSNLHPFYWSAFISIGHDK